MANIQSNLNKIKNAVLGIEVRDSIHDAIKQCYDDASAKDNANMEVKMARGEYENLGKRLDSHSSQIKEKANMIQQQVNNLVLGAVGDGNNAEVIQARGRHDLLNERFLENEFNIDLLNNATDEYVNLFRYYDSGYYVNSSDGKLYPNNLVGTTKFIDLTNIDTYIYTIVNTDKPHQMAFYDVAYEYVSGVRTEITGKWTLTIPNNAKYCKISFYLSDIGNFYVRGSSKLKKYIDSSINTVSSGVDALRNNIFGFSKNNVIDYNNSTNGGYYNGGYDGGTIGTWCNRSDVSQTEFINIEGINKVEIKIPSGGTDTVHQWVFKNSEGTIFAGSYRRGTVSSSDVIVNVEIPEGAVSISSAYVTEYPIEIYLYNTSVSDRIDELENKVASKLKGKKLGIIGDSISTYNGYIPSGYAYFFPRGNVQSVEDTWWKKLINETGMELCVNCAWSGSTISGDTDSTTNAYSGASEKRVNDLTNSNGDTPDIIIVYISINDFGKNNSVITGTSTGNESITQSGTIRDISQAYVLLIKKLMTKYPNAKIYCTTIMCEQFASEMSGSYVNGYPNINPDDNVTLPTWNNMIRAIADNMGCGLIDMAKCGINYFNLSQYTIDKLHPNIAGHELMFNQALKDIM